MCQPIWVQGLGLRRRGFRGSDKDGVLLPDRTSWA